MNLKHGLYFSLQARKLPCCCHCCERYRTSLRSWNINRKSFWQRSKWNNQKLGQLDKVWLSQWFFVLLPCLLLYHSTSHTPIRNIVQFIHQTGHHQKETSIGGNSKQHRHQGYILLVEVPAEVTWILVCHYSVQPSNEQCVAAETAGGDDSNFRLWTFVCHSRAGRFSAALQGFVTNWENRWRGWCGCCLNRSGLMSVCLKPSQTNPLSKFVYSSTQGRQSASHALKRCKQQSVWDVNLLNMCNCLCFSGLWQIFTRPILSPGLFSQLSVKHACNVKMLLCPPVVWVLKRFQAQTQIGLVKQPQIVKRIFV